MNHTELTIYSEFDPFFFLLDPLRQTKDGPFIDYIDCMNSIIEKSSEQIQSLIQILNTSPNFKSVFISNFCDHKNVLDRDLIRLNQDKLLAWLETKVNLLTDFLFKSETYLVEVSGNPAELAKITALELVRAYISDCLYLELVEKLGFNTDSVFAIATPPPALPENDAPKNGKRSQPGSSSAQPSAKKQKEAAIAKNCMKMTAFFKPK